VRALAAAFIAIGALHAQVAREANSRYNTTEGRSAVAQSLSNPERDKTQRPKQLVEHMGLKPGMTVADIGTGIGYMLPYLSEAVGSSGKVLAEDIFDDFLAKARERAAGLGNVTFIKGEPDDPKLPENAVDAILVLDVYHHFDYPERMLAAFHKALRDNGKLVVVDYYRRTTAMSNALTHIRLDAPDVIKEIEANHFRLVSQREHIKDRQYMLILEKR
jgi:ubiquinone/menaquinone biosynthesis C-methylase UbiE